MGFAPFEEKTGLNNLCNTFGFTKNKREQNHIFKMTTTENRSFKKSNREIRSFLAKIEQLARKTTERILNPGANK